LRQKQFCRCTPRSCFSKLGNCYILTGPNGYQGWGAVIQEEIIVIPVEHHQIALLPRILHRIAVTPTHFNPAYFYNGIRLVGWLQRAAKQVLFFQRLRRQFGIDTAGTQKHQSIIAMSVRGLNHHVSVDEFTKIKLFGLLVSIFT